MHDRSGIKVAQKKLINRGIQLSQFKVSCLNSDSTQISTLYLGFVSLTRWVFPLGFTYVSFSGLFAATGMPLVSLQGHLNAFNR